jgi:hypothetical protein
MAAGSRRFCLIVILVTTGRRLRARQFLNAVFRQRFSRGARMADAPL